MGAATYAGEQAAIMTRLASGWDETPVAWPNTEFDPREKVNPVLHLGYIEPVVNRQEAFNADIAPQKRIRHPGLLTVNVRVNAGVGDGAALDMADRVAALFRNVTFDGIAFRAPTVRDVGPEGAWYRVQVDCPFWRDSIH